MDFNKLKSLVKQANFDTVRADDEDCFEAVISCQYISVLAGYLQEAFGPPVFPSENKLPSDIQKVVDSRGGIISGQTLYYSDDAGVIVFAMLWPWQNGKNVTLKIFKK